MRPLLALYAVLAAVMAAIYLVMLTTDGPLLFHTWNSTIRFQGLLAFAAAACSIAIGFSRSWLLVLNGLALAALGLIQYDLAARFPIRFLTIAMLLVLMAVTTGLFERRTALVATSFAFAAAALALGLHWIRFAPNLHPDLLLLGAWFAFIAIKAPATLTRLAPATLRV